MAKKMTMRELENSPQDKAADRAGKHGPEGSAKDMREDRMLMNRINRERGFAKGGMVMNRSSMKKPGC